MISCVLCGTVPSSRYSLVDWVYGVTVDRADVLAACTCCSLIVTSEGTVFRHEQGRGSHRFILVCNDGRRLRGVMVRRSLDGTWTAHHVKEATPLFVQRVTQLAVIREVMTA